MSWILLHKKLQEHRYWKERRKFSKAEAWIDILLSANYEDRDMVISGKSFVCKRGEVMYSMETWAKRWGWTKSQVRHFIASAREAHELRTVNNTVTTHLVVCKYESYQDGKHGKRTESARKAHGLRQQDKEVQEVQEVFKGNPQKVIHPIQQFIENGSENFGLSPLENVLQLPKQLTLKQCEIIASKHKNKFISEILVAMDNHKPLLEKNTSVFATFNNWADRRLKDEQK